MLPPLLTTTDPENYQRYLTEKTDLVLSMLQKTGLSLPQAQIYASPAAHFRMRAEFGIYLQPQGFDYVMFQPGTKQRLIIQEFTPAHPAINQAMRLLQQWLPQYPVMKAHLFEDDFLCNQAGHTVISLDYHAKLPVESWQAAAHELKAKFAAAGIQADFTARARKQQILADTDEVSEHFKINQRDIYLFQKEGTFSQPNAHACRHMLEFACSCASDQKDHDLLELYCGSGTFTAALAPCFRQVLATEVARVPTQIAGRTLAYNQINNVKLVRMSAEEVSEAMHNVREFKRLQLAKINIHDYDFKTLLIDPPRSGLNDDKARAITASFDRIIYISCGPASLAEDLKILGRTHKVEKLAFFDQFPYTPHLESGVLLIRK